MGLSALKYKIPISSWQEQLAQDLQMQHPPRLAVWEWHTLRFHTVLREFQILAAASHEVSRRRDRRKPLWEAATMLGMGMTSEYGEEKAWGIINSSRDAGKAVCKIVWEKTKHGQLEYIKSICFQSSFLQLLNGGWCLLGAGCIAWSHFIWEIICVISLEEMSKWVSNLQEFLTCTT